ncbi:MAG: hypothetical protein H6842_06985 [Rhodospirillaceae bacterium]|nr:hypothetical protein [Rhodospirillaceae bacterium]
MVDVKDGWAEFLDPDVVRTKFITMGLFMIAHELLLSAIKDHPLSFFGDQWTAEKGWRQSEDYKREVLALDPKGKGDMLRGSLAWLKTNGAIDNADDATVYELTAARNMIAHELHKIIGGQQSLDLVRLFPRLTEIVTKIERWWIINVEIPTNPDWDGKEIDEDDITPSSVLLIQLLSQVALGSDESAWALYRKFVAQT